MGIISADTVDFLFSSTTTTSQGQLDSLADTALGQGIDSYQKGDYDRAISSFKRSAGLSPFSDNSAKAYDYMAKAYLAQDKVDEAIKTYEAAIKIYPVRDDFRVALGDIYTKVGDAAEAMVEYKAAVRFNQNSAQNRFSLGQSYLKAGQLSDAKEQLQAASKMATNNADGYFGLGQVARATGDYQDAITQLNKAISVNRNFEQSYLELGYTYADMGNVQKATEQLNILSEKKSSLATTLKNYMDQVAQPKILTAVGQNGFHTFFGRATSLSIMDEDLAEPDSSKLVSMNVVFSKKMDLSSIQNPYNWGISRASITQNGTFYNGGLDVPQTEAAILPIPEYITYNDKTNTASVRFRISQNAEGNATLDPAHIVFKFHGKDTYGKAIDTTADEYSGFRGVA